MTAIALCQTGDLPHFPAVVDRRHLFDHRRFHYAVSHINPLDAV